MRKTLQKFYIIHTAIDKRMNQEVIWSSHMPIKKPSQLDSFGYFESKLLVPLQFHFQHLLY